LTGHNSVVDSSILDEKNTITIDLIFPPLWIPKHHPSASLIEAAIFKKMDELGLLKTSQDKLRIKAFAISDYGGYSVPLAKYEVAYIIMFYITLWLFWDDKVVEGTDKKLSDFDKVLDTIAGKYIPKDEDDVYTKAWGYVSSELTKIIIKFNSCKINKTECKDPNNFLYRLSTAMKQWVMYSLRETEVTNNKGNAELQTFTDYDNTRMISIGMIPMSILLELCLEDNNDTSSENIVNGEVTYSIDRKDIMDTTDDRINYNRLVECASRVVAYANELLSLAKDINCINVESGSINNWCNIITAHSLLYKSSLYESVIYVTKLLDNVVHEYDSIPYENEQYKNNLRLCASGFAYWHTICKRYIRQAVVVNTGDCDNKAIVFKIKYG
jgi:hypothetical protein